MNTIAIPTVGRSFGSLIKGGDRPPTENPCWANSYDVDDERCAAFQHAVDADELGPMLTEVEKWARQEKQPGKRFGPIRANGIAVLRYLYNEARRNAGYCCPSRDQIAEALRISRSCVEDTLVALRDCGLIEWIRRTIAGEGEGPARKQTSNLYRFTMPKALAWRVSKFLLRKFKRTPRIPRSLAGTFTPEQLAARATQAAAQRVMRSIRRRVRRGDGNAAPEPENRYV